MKRLNLKVHLRAKPTENWDTSLIYTKQDIDEGATFARDIGYVFAPYQIPKTATAEERAKKMQEARATYDKNANSWETMEGMDSIMKKDIQSIILKSAYALDEDKSVDFSVMNYKRVYDGWQIKMAPLQSYPKRLWGHFIWIR